MSHSQAQGEGGLYCSGSEPQCSPGLTATPLSPPHPAGLGPGCVVWLTDAISLPQKEIVLGAYSLLHFH